MERAAYTLEAAQLAAAALNPRGVPLIGFCGAPFTLACYLIEGRGAKNFPQAAEFRHRHPGAWRDLQEKLVDLNADYLRAQAGAGASALHEFIERERFDLVLACDVGGDFIAAPENLDVLSPMMDAYALSALRRLQASITGTNFLYCVFGLGTDGESTPAQLRAALANVGRYGVGKFEPDAVTAVNDFYRAIIEVNRRSRTADFTLRGIHGEVLEPAVLRVRFHTHPRPGEIKKHYGEFWHVFDQEFAGRYYLFEDLSGVQNPFEFHCINGIEWFIGVQGVGAGLNHELNGQAYLRVEDVLQLSGVPTRSLFFGTPSFKFSGPQRRRIVSDVAGSVLNGVYDTALVLTPDCGWIEESGVAHTPLDDSLTLISRRDKPLPDALVAELMGLHGRLGR